jgi:hypothetical protein
MLIQLADILKSHELIKKRCLFVSEFQEMHLRSGQSPGSTGVRGSSCHQIVTGRMRHSLLARTLAAPTLESMTTAKWNRTAMAEIDFVQKA